MECEKTHPTIFHLSGLLSQNRIIRHERSPNISSWRPHKSLFLYSDIGICSLHRHVIFITYTFLVWLKRHYLIFSVLSLENDRSAEAQEAVRNLVLMIATLSMCGYVELRPNAASMGCIFQILGFCMPQPSGRGNNYRTLFCVDVQPD